MISMTGYAYINKRTKKYSLQVMLRSGNFKYLEAAVRLPHDNILLEEKIKRSIRQKISRGKVEVQVLFKKHAEGQVYIDEAIVKKYVNQMKVLAKKYGFSSDVKISELLALPHVINWEEKDENDNNEILAAVEEGINQLVAFKKKEGKVVKSEMLKNLKNISSNVQVIRQHKPSGTKESDIKEDIDEELSLMSFYVTKLEKKVSADSSEFKGKEVDFLTQEILRELNASSSKTKDKTSGALIVECKNYLDRIREQAQNIE